MSNLNGNVRLLGWFSDQNSGGTITGSGTPNTIAMFTGASTIGDSKITQNAAGSTMAFAPVAATSGVASTFTFTTPNNTGRTASTEVNSVNYVMGTQTWATGALATQRSFLITGPTLAFVGASVVTNAYTLYATAPTAGANATITNSFAAGFAGKISIADGTSNIQLGNLFGSTTIPAIYMVSSPSGSNYSLTVVSGGSIFNDPSGSNTITFQTAASGLVQFNGAKTTGNANNFLFISPVSTGITASTETTGFKVNGTVRTWATGAISMQREFNIIGSTYNFAGASVITNAFGLYVDPATAGTNATITNNWAIGTTGNVLMGVGSVTNGIKFTGMVGTLTNWAIYTDQATPSASNYTFGGTANQTRINAAADIILRIANTTIINLDSSTQQFTPQAVGSGSPIPFTFTLPNSTGQTASSETIGFNWVSGTITHATGTITTQRDYYMRSRTHAFVGASTITDAYAHYIDAPTAGSNATITNNWALGLNGALKVENGFKVQIGNAAVTGLVAGTLAATTNASIVLYDSTGQAYRIPCII